MQIWPKINFFLQNSYFFPVFFIKLQKLMNIYNIPEAFWLDFELISIPYFLTFKQNSKIQHGRSKMVAQMASSCKASSGLSTQHKFISLICLK